MPSAAGSHWKLGRCTKRRLALLASSSQNSIPEMAKEKMLGFQVTWYEGHTYGIINTGIFLGIKIRKVNSLRI